MSDKEIVDRLKMEGDLTRNKGKHSVKAVLLKMNKFQDLFISIDRSLMEQTAILRSNLSMNAEEIERLKREANFHQNDQQNPESVTPKPKSIPAVDGAVTDKSFFGGIAALIGGAFSGVGLSAFRGVIGKSVISAFGLFLAPAIGDWVSDFIEQSLKNLNFDDITASVAGDALGNATTMGLLGSIISKRMGILFAGGGFVASFADDIASALGFTEEQMQQDLIMGLSAQDISQGVMFAIGTTLSAVLMKRSVWAGLFSMSGSAASTILSKTGLGVLARTTIPMAVAGLYLTYGEEAKNFLDNYVPEDISSIVVDTASAAAFGGSIAGIPGAIIGAALGFVFSIGSSLVNWFEKNEAEAKKKLEEKLDPLTVDQSIDLIKSGDRSIVEYTESYGRKEGGMKYIDSVPIDKVIGVIDQNTSGNLSAEDLANLSTKMDTLNLKVNERTISNLSQEEINKIYTELTGLQSKIENLYNSPNASDPNSSENAAITELELMPTATTDLYKMIELLENQGKAKKVQALTIDPIKGYNDPSKMIALEPPISTSDLQATMNAGIAEKSAHLNMVQMGGPKIFNSGGNSSVTNNSSVNVVTGSENKLFGIGFAQ